MGEKNGGDRQAESAMGGLVWRLVRFCRAISRDETGGTLVEAALVISCVLTPLLLGAAELGRINYMAIEVSNAAAAGAQYGSQNAAAAGNTSGIQTAAQNDGADVNSTAGLTVSSSTFYQCYVSSTGSSTSATASTNCGTGHLVEFLQVNTQSSVTPLIRYPGSPATYNLTGQAVVRIVQ